MPEESGDIQSRLPSALRQNEPLAMKSSLAVRSPEEFLELSQGILRSASGSPSRIEFLREVSRLLLEFSGADELEIGHYDGDIRYLWRATRESRHPYDFALLHGSDDPEGIASAFPGGLEKLCRIVLAPAQSKASGFLTAGGSLWTDDVRHLPPALLPESLPTLRSGKSIRSLAIFPFLYTERNRGIVLIASGQPRLVAVEQIALHEGVVQILGLASAHRRAQWALGERVKELSCLYEIAQIVDKPEWTRAEKLQRIIDLLPPALQHPDVAAARIDLDHATYLTSMYRAGRYREQTSIIVKGRKRGTLEIIYIEGKPEHAEGPFLKEEAALIAEVARQVAGIIEREEAEETKIRLELQVRRADRLATLGQLAAGVAHELNEPLGGVLGFAQLAKKSLGDTPQLEKDLDKIIKTALHGRDIVQKLLIFSRQMPPSKGRVDLSHVASEVLSFFEARCKKEGIIIVRRLGEELPGIVADPGQISELIMNLVVNALQAMPQGGTLTVEISRRETSVVLGIEDTGAGMSEETKRQIFDPFFTTKDVGQGTGLGLSIVHGIVTAHGGS
ncbi:hypothetical protein KJ815_11585, partial [bacterium]|nr:hypothetical protein [bacterium]